MPLPSRGFVGEANTPAGEYHSQDFEWEELRAEIEATGRLEEDRPQGATWQQDAAAAHWERFHATCNGTARFYKERRYILLEFPALMVQTPPQHFVEIGCGVGSSLLPILKANPSCQVTGTDLSPSAVSMFKTVAAAAGISPDRLHAFALDSADSTTNPLQGLQADALLLIFTLAAVTPEEMPVMLGHAFQALREGGLLLIRDHGLYDITHLRLPASQRVGNRLYQRHDGTTCYFFSTEDLSAKVQAAGFEVVECTYACVMLRNRKKNLVMKRVFVHCIARRPVS